MQVVGRGLRRDLHALLPGFGELRGKRVPANANALNRLFARQPAGFTQAIDVNRRGFCTGGARQLQNATTQQAWVLRQCVNFLSVNRDCGEIVARSLDLNLFPEIDSQSDVEGDRTRLREFYSLGEFDEARR